MLGSDLCLAAKRFTGAGGFYFSRTGLNDPYGPRGDIRPRARHSQAGVSQLSNGTAPVLGGIRSHRQGGGGTEGAQGQPGVNPGAPLPLVPGRMVDNDETPAC